VRGVQLAGAAAAAVLAAVALLLAADLRRWGDSVAAGDARLEQAPGRVEWEADVALPGDAARRLLSVDDDLEWRRALAAYLVASRTPRGFDAGERRVRARSSAEALLGEVVATSAGSRASQAENLLGVLVHGTGRVADGATGEDRALAAFETAVRLDPGNADARFNLELMLRRAEARGTREGPNAGSGPRGRGRRGAGAGLPGRGY
jgi:hypothetical protein